MACLDLAPSLLKSKFHLPIPEPSIYAQRVNNVYAQQLFFWAALSACFAALTALFAKVGIRGVDSDFATLLRTVIILVVLTAFVWCAGKWSDPRTLSPKTLLFLTLSALATGASWVCYFRALRVGEASKVAPVDKFSLVLVVVFAFAFLGERPSAREWLGIGLVASGVLALAIKT